MRSDIRVCANWETAHDRPVYTLGDRCPRCDGPAGNGAPAPFDPTDRYGEYRRRARPDGPDGSGLDRSSGTDSGGSN